MVCFNILRFFYQIFFLFYTCNIEVLCNPFWASRFIQVLVLLSFSCFHICCFSRELDVLPCFLKSSQHQHFKLPVVCSFLFPLVCNQALVLQYYIVRFFLFLDKYRRRRQDVTVTFIPSHLPKRHLHFSTAQRDALQLVNIFVSSQYMPQCYNFFI